LAAVVATAVAKGTVVGLVGVLMISLGVWMKARLEETWLTGHLEAGAYEQYRRKIPMLIPFLPGTQ
jgi:protein-S-isoprenylcysteine O-methyltransferase Ste14